MSRNRRKNKNKMVTVSQRKMKKWDKTSRIVGDIEAKFYNQDLQQNPDSATVAVITPLSNIAQGINSSERLGDSINPISLTVKGYITFLDTAGGGRENQTIRILFLRDKLQAGLAPLTSAAVDVGRGILEDTDVNSFKNMEGTIDRFEVLFDRRISFTRLGTETRKMFSFHKKLSGKIEYTGAAAASTNLMKNNLYMFLLVDIAAVATPTQASIYTTLLYRDS